MSLVAIFALALSTNCTRVGAGSVGIKVSYSGSNRGVEDYPLQTGWVWYNPLGSTVVEYPTFVQTAVWTKDTNEGSSANEEISFNSKDGMVFYADVNISYHLNANKVPAFYLKYKADDIDKFTHGMLHQVARDAFNLEAASYTADDLYGAKKEEYLDHVRTRVNSQFDDVGLVLDSIGFVGAPRPPQSYLDALTAKVNATQKAQQAQNELVEAKAQAAKQVALAQGVADSNAIINKSITPELVRWKMLEIQQQAIQKWNGQRPHVEVNGSSGNQGFLLNIPMDSK